MRRRTLVLAGILAIGLPLVTLAGDAREGRAMVDQSYLCGRTLLEMRSVAIALSAYLIDNPTLPDDLASIDQVRPLIEPMYIGKAVLEDAWGTSFRVWVGPDGKAFRLVSAGSDREFDETSWSRAGLLAASGDDAVISSSRAETREWVIQE